MNIGNAKECCPRILAPRISFPKSCPGTGIGVPKSFPGTRNDALRALSLEPGLVFPKAPGLRSQSPSPALEPPVPPRILPGFSALGASPHPPWAQGRFRGVKRSQVSSWSCRMEFCPLGKDINARGSKGGKLLERECYSPNADFPAERAGVECRRIKICCGCLGQPFPRISEEGEQKFCVSQCLLHRILLQLLP